MALFTFVFNGKHAVSRRITAKLTFLLFFTLFSLAILPGSVYGQNKAAKIEDFFTAFNDYAAEMGGAMTFMGGMGLTWSDPYIGPLINQIPHWGAGLSLGFTSTSLANIDKLMEPVQLELKPLVGKKQFNLMYTGDFRIGGFRLYPFDVGFKFGLLPGVPMVWGNSDFKYSMRVIGGDVRWRVNSGFGLSPKISVGLEVNFVNGDYTIPIAPDAAIFENVNASSGSGSGYRITPNDDATMAFKWNATVFDLKVDLAKRFPYSGIALYGGIKAGFALTGTSFVLAGPEVAVGTNGTATNNKLVNKNPTAMETAQEDLQTRLPYGNASLSADGVTIAFPGTAFDLKGNIGVDFQFDFRWHLSIGFIVDALHFESGFTLAWRYQQ